MKPFFLSVLAGMTAVLLLTGCNATSSNNSQPQSESIPVPSSQSTAVPSSSSSEISRSIENEASSSPETSEPEESTSVPEETDGGKTLVVYFSASGNTKAVAEIIAETTGGELYELVPVEPYTDSDLNWTDPNSRVNVEHNDPSHRTAISGTKDLSGYDTIFVGYPLWWQEAPSIVWNFVENADLAGKTMIPFCTSTSSPFGTSGETLAGMAPDADWMDGMRFREHPDEAAVTDWVSSLELAVS